MNSCVRNLEGEFVPVISEIEVGRRYGMLKFRESIGDASLCGRDRQVVTLS